MQGLSVSAYDKALNEIQRLLGTYKPQLDHGMMIDKARYQTAVRIIAQLARVLVHERSTSRERPTPRSRIAGRSADAGRGRRVATPPVAPADSPVHSS